MLCLRVEHHWAAQGDEKAGACEASKPSREAGLRASRAGEGRLVTESPRAHHSFLLLNHGLYLLLFSDGQLCAKDRH